MTGKIAGIKIETGSDGYVFMMDNDLRSASVQPIGGGYIVTLYEGTPVARGDYSSKWQAERDALNFVLNGREETK